MASFDLYPAVELGGTESHDLSSTNHEVFDDSCQFVSQSTSDPYIPPGFEYYAPIDHCVAGRRPEVLQHFWNDDLNSCPMRSPEYLNAEVDWLTSASISSSPSTSYMPTSMIPGPLESRLSSSEKWLRSGPSSISSNDSEYSQNSDGAQQQCMQCSEKFDSYQALDKHARQTLHKAWRCPEPECIKAYARRDVYLRHRSTHRQGGFKCSICRQSKQHRQFKRKDHYKDHLRKCHDVKTGSLNTLDLPKFAQPSQGTEFDRDLSYHTSQQKEHFRVIVGSLKKLLPDGHGPLIEKLEDTLDTLEGPNMESVAENMAGAAILQASLTAAKSC